MAPGKFPLAILFAEGQRKLKEMVVETTIRRSGQRSSPFRSTIDLLDLLQANGVHDARLFAAS
jgi:hypothetical protein